MKSMSAFGDHVLKNARVLTAAVRFGSFRALSPEEIVGQGEFDPPSGQRAWGYWARRAGGGDQLSEMP